MATEKHVLSLIDPRREVSRPSLVGMKLLHQKPVRAADILRGRPWRNAKDLLRLLRGHFAVTRRMELPRCRTTISVFTPAGMPAIKISHE